MDPSFARPLFAADELVPPLGIAVAEDQNKDQDQPNWKPQYDSHLLKTYKGTILPKTFAPIRPGGASVVPDGVAEYVAKKTAKTFAEECNSDEKWPFDLAETRKRLRDLVRREQDMSMSSNTAGGGVAETPTPVMSPFFGRKSSHHQETYTPIPSPARNSNRPNKKMRASSSLVSPTTAHVHDVLKDANCAKENEHREDAVHHFTSPSVEEYLVSDVPASQKPTSTPVKTFSAATTPTKQLHPCSPDDVTDTAGSFSTPLRRDTPAAGWSTPSHSITPVTRAHDHEEHQTPTKSTTSKFLKTMWSLWSTGGASEVPESEWSQDNTINFDRHLSFFDPHHSASLVSGNAAAVAAEIGMPNAVDITAKEMVEEKEVIGVHQSNEQKLVGEPDTAK